ncbi:hypothetical protein [Alkalitalea saponilacus]|uniref:SpoIIAA-like n=1 Tax=Alkalitalea saponilacus TaxID=889453 RepID=A0A1T5HSI3_9BACT|nr:hypothetical protein [Alkalitalea saponilacus]ASB48347.1 hypothetical protein CDL62_03895 [Alkalitalea saponilacus]SKC23572.1 hypothetical protein SAMN03080601_02848 [Alkalitalea saponilacus]
MEIYSSPVVRIEFDTTKKLLLQKWIGFASSVQFREAIDKTVEFVKGNQVKYLMSNTVEQKPVGPEESKYAASVMPQLFGGGVKAMAFVMPKNVITKLALSSFAKEKGMPDNVQYFDNLAEAETWLLKH